MTKRKRTKGQTTIYLQGAALTLLWGTRVKSKLKINIYVYFYFLFRVARSFLLFCRSLFIVLSVLLRFTGSDYPFGIFSSSCSLFICMLLMLLHVLFKYWWNQIILINLHFTSVEVKTFVDHCCFCMRFVP